MSLLEYLDRMWVEVNKKAESGLSFRDVSIIHICSIRLMYIEQKIVMSNVTKNKNLGVTVLAAVIHSTNLSEVALLFQQIIVLFCSRFCSRSKEWSKFKAACDSVNSKQNLVSGLKLVGFILLILMQLIMKNSCVLISY